MNTNVYPVGRSPRSRAFGSSRSLIALLAVGCFGSCSIQDFDYLTDGKSPGGKDSGGAAGDTGQQGGGGADAGATSTDPSAGGSTSGGSSGAQCSDGKSFCETASACFDLNVGSPSGSTVDHCGDCNTTCSLTNASAATCTAGKCISTCTTGFGDCNGAALNDGCEVSTTTVTACGKCGRPCSNAGVATRVCTDGACKPTCSVNFADCKPDTGSGADDGCETNINSQTHCGTNCADSVACADNKTCTAGVCGAPQGLVVLTVPLASQGQAQRYADKFSFIPDLTNAAVTLRLYAPGATGGVMTVYLSDENFTGGGGGELALKDVSQRWTDVTYPVGGISGDFDPVVITQINMEIKATDSGPWTNPTVVYLDGIWSSNGAVADTFGASIGGMVASSMMKVDGATLTWTGAMP